MVLHRYFKISSKFPDPNDPFLNTVPQEVIKAVKNCQAGQREGRTKLSEGPYRQLVFPRILA